MKFRITRITWIGLITLIGFPILAFILLLIFSDGWTSFVGIFQTQLGYLTEVILGTCYGVVTGIIAWVIIKSSWMRPILMKYGHMVQGLKLSPFQIVFLSVCAGAGEEVFFRGALQPFWGVWITAVFFVAIHGYLNFKDLKIFVYGLYMTIVIAGMGWLKMEYGLISAILAHIAVDVVLFYNLTYTKILKRKQKTTKEILWSGFEEE
jgi:membrane protease YdiL (CAAX protease family)